MCLSIYLDIRLLLKSKVRLASVFRGFATAASDLRRAERKAAAKPEIRGFSSAAFGFPPYPGRRAAGPSLAR